MALAVAAARLFRSFRHRVTLPRVLNPKAHDRRDVELQLLGQLAMLTNTVLLDGNSTTCKAIVAKARFKLLNLKSLCRGLLGNGAVAARLDRLQNARLKEVQAIIGESLGNGADVRHLGSQRDGLKITPPKGNSAAVRPSTSAVVRRPRGVSTPVEPCSADAPANNGQMTGQRQQRDRGQSSTL